MNRKKIAFAGPWITQKEKDYVMDALDNGWYETYDMHTKKLEQALRDYLGVKHVLATHCCTVALHLACAALGLSEDDEVIVTDHSWVATAYAVAYTGAKCVFVDIDEHTLCIDPYAIERAITSKTKAIMLVHNFGLPAEMDSIMAIARKYKLRVIEDAAPSLGSEYKGKKTGTFGDFGCFSFQGAKIAVTGEGGCILTNDDALFEKARLLANMGRTDRISPFWSDSLGYQYTISNLSASLALAQVERIDELVARKRQIFDWYDARLGNDSRFQMVREREGTFGNYCYPSLFLTDEVSVKNEDILARFRELNIHARPGFPQMSHFPEFEARFENPVAHSFWKRGLVLPSAANVTEEDVEFVCETLKGICSRS